MARDSGGKIETFARDLPKEYKKHFALIAERWIGIASTRFSMAALNAYMMTGRAQRSGRLLAFLRAAARGDRERSTILNKQVSDERASFEFAPIGINEAHFYAQILDLGENPSRSLRRTREHERTVTTAFGRAIAPTRVTVPVYQRVRPFRAIPTPFMFAGRDDVDLVGILRDIAIEEITKAVEAAAA